jgi:hypothetical protein
MPHFHKVHFKNNRESNHGEGCKLLSYFEDGICSCMDYWLMWPLESVRSQQASMQGSTKDGCAREEEEEEEEDVWHEKNTKRCFTIVVGASFFAN